MAGVLIYKSALNQHYSFLSADNGEYVAIRVGILENINNKILWERENVSLEQIEKARKTKDELVAKLNKGKKVNLKKKIRWLLSIIIKTLFY